MSASAPLAADTPRTLEEMVRLGAVNAPYFCYTFFPRTFRQTLPRMHYDVWDALDSQDRYINIQMPRGFAKTSLLRAYVARRIAYGFAHTLLYIGRSETAAVRSASWLRSQVENNKLYTETFGLRAGTKMQDTEMQIWHGTDEYPVWMMATGITGSVRGINRDDYRPDTIILDDVLDDENSLTKEQRLKYRDLIYGAVLASLAPASEAPDAKLVMLQTPLDAEDASTQALNNPLWRSLRFSCWTPETENAPLHEQESAWPERYPTRELRKLKASYIAENNASTFAREYECKLVARESCSFKAEWLQYFDTPPEYGTRVLVIDPVPPPSEAAVAKGLHDTDYECLMVLQRTGNEYFVLEYETNRGHDPSWTIATFFTLAMRWNPSTVVVDSVAYQRTLAWLLRRAMEQQGRFWAVREYLDSRPKFNRIVDAVKGIASARHLHVRRSHADLIQQFTNYRNVSHDDVLECVAMGLDELNSAQHDFDQNPDAYAADTDATIPELVYARGAP